MAYEMNNYFFVLHLEWYLPLSMVFKVILIFVYTLCIYKLHLLSQKHFQEFCG